MTQWHPVSLRQPGRAWSGINTRMGHLDDGSGQLTDESTNVMINSSDTLQKRKGMVRGLDERFDGPVCGLHRYTDECGIEHLLVADSGGISIRQPFAIPVFEFSDAYPFDNFHGTGIPDPSRWLGLSGYQRLDDALQIVLGEAPDPLVWFKEASNQSYQLRIEYEFDELSGQAQQINMILKAADATAQTARIELRIQFDGTTTTIGQVFFIDSALGQTLLLEISPTNITTKGVATLSYKKATRTARIEWFPTLSPQIIFDTDALTVLQDVDLGQRSAIQIVGDSSATRVLVIDGGPV